MGAHHRAGSGRCSQQSKEKYRTRTRWPAYLSLARAVAVSVDRHHPDLQRVGQAWILQYQHSCTNFQPHIAYLTSHTSLASRIAHRASRISHLASRSSQLAAHSLECAVRRLSSSPNPVFKDLPPYLLVFVSHSICQATLPLTLVLASFPSLTNNESTAGSFWYHQNSLISVQGLCEDTVGPRSRPLHNFNPQHTCRRKFHTSWPSEVSTGDFAVLFRAFGILELLRFRCPRLTSLLRRPYRKHYHFCVRLNPFPSFRHFHDSPPASC